MTYKTFSSTVRSGVGWLGDIPSHWAVVPAKALFSLRAVKASPDDVHLTPSQKFGVLPQVEYMEITGSRVVLNLTESGQMKHVEPNDFVSHLRSFQGGLELSRVRGKVSGAYTVLKSRGDQNPEFWKYAFKSDSYIQALQTTTDQLRDGQSIRLKEFAQIPLPLVPRVEQDSIVEFLDREIGKLDNLLKEFSRLESAVIEKSKSLILNSVTLGVREHQALKEVTTSLSSRVPETWEVKKVKHSIKSIKGGAWGEEPLEGELPGIWCVRVADFDRARLSVSKSNPTFRHYKNSELGGRVIEMGDLILEKSGGGEASPVGAIVRFAHDELAVCSNFAAVVKLKSGQDSRYWAYAHSSLYYLGLTRRSIKQTTDIQNLDTSKYLDELVGFPDFEEQMEIADFLDEQTSKLERLRTHLAETQRKVIERRSALIDAAVTGKLNVRGEHHG